MNTHVAFNTHAFVKRLESAGMEVAQAEALAEALSEIVFETTATKSDLRELELRLANNLKDLELRLMSRLGAVVAGSTALTIAILGALITLKG
jgi:hypothetical protein